MAVYVDNFYETEGGRFGRMKMSHLMADTKEELLSMVDTIGVQRRWIQYEDTFKEHFDISKSKRELAIKAGAIPITLKEMGEYMSKRIDKIKP
jgi:hypothetical protein